MFKPRLTYFVNILKLAGQPERCKSTLRNIIAKKIENHQKKLKAFGKSRHIKFQAIELDYLYSGMHGMVPMVWEVSEIHHEQGLKYRGYTIEETLENLPKEPNSDYPAAEGLFWLLLTGDIPNQEQVLEMRSELTNGRQTLPEEAQKLLKGSFAKSVSPISRLVATLTVISQHSKFRAGYGTTRKAEYWISMLEDGLDLVAILPEIFALSYRFTYYNDGARGSVEPNSYWCSNVLKMLGAKDHEFGELIKLLVVCYADHDGANVCTHTSHLVGSTLSDPYLSLASGYCSLGGPYEGGVAKDALAFIENVRKEVDGKDYSFNKLKPAILRYINSGKLIPGFGHHVLKRTDPRFEALAKFGNKHLNGNENFKLAMALSNEVPRILRERKMVRNPNPNVEFLKGVILNHYGITQTDFYCCFIALARVLGVTAGLIWDRAAGIPLERPKSFSTSYMQKHFITPDILK